jgi:hypothetical protein
MHHLAIVTYSHRAVLTLSAAAFVRAGGPPTGTTTAPIVEPMEIGYALSSEEHPPLDLVHVYVHQIGPDQEGFFRFYEERILPELD